VPAASVAPMSTSDCSRWNAAGATARDSLGLRPVYHHREDRIRAHIQLCWLALLLIRVGGDGTAAHARQVNAGCAKAWERTERGW